MKLNWKTTLCLSTFGFLFSPLAQAQFCSLTNASLSGAYGYVASEPGASATTTGTTGTGTTTGTTAGGYSNTGIGQLLGGVAGGNQFALSGVWVFDGQGNVATTSMPGGTLVDAGTYKVNSDCSVSVSIADVFGTNTTATQFAGVILGRGAEIDLMSETALQSESTTTGITTGTGTTAETGTTTGTGTTTTTGTVTSSTTTNSGLAIRLVRTLLNSGCTDANLNGLYGFVLNPIPTQTPSSSTGTTVTTGTTGTGTTTTTTTTTASEPFGLIGYLDFNGSGQIVPLTSSSTTSTTTAVGNATGPSSFSALDYSGTYAVNSDCSGTITINQGTLASSSGTTATGAGTGTSSAANAITINFVLTPPTNSGAIATTAQTPGLTLSYSQGSTSGSGYASAQ
jgi:hypothetical protein